MPGLESRDFTAPDETRTPDKTTVELVNMAGGQIGRYTFQPGWKWSECIKPVVGGDSCQAHHVGVVPHNPLSPVSTAACVQLAACIPNFVLQELPLGEDQPPKSEIVRRPLRVENGFIVVPDAPGIGIELTDDAAERHPYRPREVSTRRHVDGSVIDQ